MRFMSRSLLGMVLLTLTAGLILLSVKVFMDAFEERSESGRRGGGNRERVFAVNVIEPKSESIVPVITTFGEVVSGKTLELRAAAGGALVQLSPNFREGAAVSKGEVLFQTDPAAAQANLSLAETELTEAKAELAEATDALALSQDEVQAAQDQLSLREQAAERQQSLRTRGVGTEAALESAKLAVSSANQALLSKRQNIANARSRINRAKISLSRRTINRDEAERKLNDSTVVASFDGVLANVSGVLGGLVNASERMANLIDPSALEVAFRVSSAQFAELAANAEGLSAAKVKVSFTGVDLPLNAKIERVSAAVGEGQTGRELFARFVDADAAILRTGDFVTVRIEEPPLANAAHIPASAVSTTGELLLVGDEDRIEAVSVEILRKQGDRVIVSAELIAGKRLVEKRAPQLGEGIRVEPRNRGDGTLAEQKMVQLTPAQQAQIVEGVKANTFIPQQVKDRILKRVATGEVPEDNFQRMKRYLKDGAAPKSEGAPKPDGAATVSVDDATRAKMIAFVEANDRMPPEAKTRILQNLQQADVPKRVYDRLTKRMGG